LEPMKMAVGRGKNAGVTMEQQTLTTEKPTFARMLIN